MLYKFREFIQAESTASFVLLVSMLTALVLSNSEYHTSYFAIANDPINFCFKNHCIESSVSGIINNFLMSLFFLNIGIEMKYQLIAGELQNRRQLILSALSAVGGMVVPMMIYFLISYDYYDLRKGVAIPSATDTAFVLGLMSLFGRKIPVAATVFVMGFAVIDDLLAIAIIAFFYSNEIHLVYLLITLLIAVIMGRLYKREITNTSYYVIMGIIIWYCIYNSGVTPTLSGILLALFIPIRLSDDSYHLYNKLSGYLRPIVAYLVMPLFAFFNVGVSLENIITTSMYMHLFAAIFVGLVVGKPVGILTTSFILIKTGVCSLPSGTSWSKYISISLLAGFGFTVSLFIGNIVFHDPLLQNQMRASVVTAAITAGVLGVIALSYITRRD